jgi:hypothetical protein
VTNTKAKFQAKTPKGFVEAYKATYIGDFSTGALPPSSTAFHAFTTLPHPTPVMAAIAAARARRDFMVANPNADFDAAAMRKQLVEEKHMPGDDDLERSDRSTTGAYLCHCVCSFLLC